MRKPCDMPLKRFAAQLTEINNFLHILPSLDAKKNMTNEELKEILLHALPNGWENQSWLQVWNFEIKAYRETCVIFERMEISEQVYEGQTPSKRIIGQITTVRVISGR